MTQIILKGKEPDKDPWKRLEAIIGGILMLAGVFPNEVDTCMEWAFGKDAWEQPPWPVWVNRWHKLHPTGPKIERKESFVETMFVIGRLYVHRAKEGTPDWLPSIMTKKK